MSNSNVQKCSIPLATVELTIPRKKKLSSDHRIISVHHFSIEQDHRFTVALRLWTLTRKPIYITCHSRMRAAVTLNVRQTL